MADPFTATTPEEQDDLLLRAYYEAQGAPAGQRLSTFQSRAPEEQYLPGPQAALVRPDPGQGGAGGTMGMPRAVVPAEQAMPGQSAPIVIQPTTIAAPPPRSAAAMARPAPIIAPEVTIAPGRPAPPRKPAGISKAILDSAIRRAATSGEQSEGEQFDYDYANEMGEPTHEPFRPNGDAGLVPHKVGLTVKPFLPGEEQQLNEAENEQFAAQREQGEAQIQSAQDIADQMVQHADAQEAVDQRFAEREMERQNMLRDRETRFAEMADRVANQPIEAPSLWGDTTGEKVLNRIAVFLGGIGQGASAAGGDPGAVNLAYQKLQKDLENNMAVQKEKRALQIGRLKDEQTLIEMARERFKSESAVDAAMREAAYRRLGSELERFKEFAKTPERKAALDALMAQNNAQLSNLAIQRRQAMDADVMKERQIRAAASARDPLAELKLKAKASGYRADIAKNESIIRGGGEPDKSKLEVAGYGYARTQKDAEDLRDAIANYEQGMENLNKVQRIMDQGGSSIGVGGTLGTKAYREGSVSKAQLETNIAKSYGGVIQQSDRIAASKEAPDPTAILPQDAKLEAAREKLRSGLRSQIRQKIVGAPQKFTPQGGGQ